MTLKNARRAATDILNIADERERANKLMYLCAAIDRECGFPKGVFTEITKSEKIRQLDWDNYIKIPVITEYLYKDLATLMNDSTGEQAAWELYFAVVAEWVASCERLEASGELANMIIESVESSTTPPPAEAINNEIDSPRGRQMIEAFIDAGYIERIAETGKRYKWTKKKRLFVVFAVELNEFLGIGGIVNKWKPYEQLFDGITAHEMSVTYQHIKDKTRVRDYDEYNNIFRKAAREIKSKATN